MIKQVIRLVKPGLFLPCFEVEKYRPQAVLIRPRYLSICAADQRYFQGNRPPEVLAQKLPLSLFHEAVGEVLHDPTGELQTGSYCVLLPGGHDSLEDDSNYKKGAFFRSSNADGFCQELMYMDKQELIPVPNEPVWPYVFTELMSVCVQGIRRLEKVTELTAGTRVGIWGDGAMAYMMALTLSQMKQKCCIAIFGKHDDKLMNFSFVGERINISDKNRKVDVEVAIECVGGLNSQKAIADAIESLSPTGTLLLMGVSEILPTVSTRMVLEKGLTIIGSSRSIRQDFIQAVELIAVPHVQYSLFKLNSHPEVCIKATDFSECFNNDIHNSYKTIIKSYI